MYKSETACSLRVNNSLDHNQIFKKKNILFSKKKTFFEIKNLYVVQCRQIFIQYRNNKNKLNKF